MQSVQLGKLYVVAWLDASGGLRQGSKHSRSSIATVGMDDSERVFILSSWAAHCGTDWMIDKVFKTQLQWKPVVFGMDASATQILLADNLRKESRDRGIPIPLRPLSLRADKTFNIEVTLQPLAAAGRLFRPPEGEVQVLKAETMAFPNGLYRDALDALACAVRLLPTSSPAAMRDMSTESYKRYLERTGATPDEVRRRIAARPG